MASGTVQTGLIEKVQINNGTEHRIASTAYGICSTQAHIAKKTVQIDGFELVPGVTIHIKFTHDNTASTPPTLNVNGTGDIGIAQYDNIAIGVTSETSGWQAGAVISLTYDGTYWVRDQGYNTNTTYATLTQELINIGTETTGKLITAKILKDTIADAFQNADLDNLGIASASHTHGNIQNNGALQTNDITISDGDKLVVTNVNDNGKIARTSIEFDTSITSEVLSKAGTWVNMYTHPNTSGNKHIPTGGESGQFLGWSADGTAAWVNNPNTDTHRPIKLDGVEILGNNNTPLDLVAGSYISLAYDNNNNEVTITNTMTAANLGLANAMHFIGFVRSDSTYTPSDGSNQTPSIYDLSSYTPVAGDVVIDANDSREYVYTKANTWELLGQDASTTYDSNTLTTLSDFQVNRTNTWISRIQQNSDRTISVERAELDTSGEWSGKAAKATILETARTILIDLESTTAASFDGSTNITPGVTGILPIANGGTNTSTAPTAGGVIYGGTLNNEILYASTGAGSAGQVLISQGTNAPIWYAGLLLTGNGTQASPYDATFNNTVTITGATTLSSTLLVAGNSTLTGKVGIGASPDNNYQLYVNGNSQFNGNLIPTITNSNADKTLGNSSNRWASVYIGTKDSYGDIYTPIYWNSGVPAEVTPVQRINFTFDTTNPSSLPFVHSAITLDTSVIEIVVEDGISYLNSPINWTIIEDTDNDNTPTLILSATTNLSSDQTITGYIKIAHTANLTFSSNT